MFTSSYGFIVDYLAQVLKMQRALDYSDAYRKYFELDQTLSVRDKLGINKTFSGLMKIIYPHRDVSKEEIEQLLVFAMEGRRRIKMEILRIDPTFDTVRFAYKDLETSQIKEVHTAEELKYPMLTKGRLPSLTDKPKPEKITPKMQRTVEQTDITLSEKAEQTISSADQIVEQGTHHRTPPGREELKQCHFAIAENQTGISYRSLFGPYLRGAKKITVIDPYIRKSYQIRNLVEFMQVVLDNKPEGEEIAVHLITDSDEFSRTEIDETFQQVQDDLQKVDIDFTYEFDTTGSLHARSITTDTGWKILLDRGLDIFQRSEGGWLSISSIDQRARYCKAFEVTFVRNEP